MSGGGNADLDVVERRGREPKMCEGWLEHKYGGSSWQRIWLVLKGSTIYVFKSKDTSQANQMGNLIIDRDATFVNLKSDQKKGFKFELKTGRRLNKFKTEKSSEREEWRAYVLGLAAGRIPDDIDLLPRDRTDIQNKIDAYQKGSNRQSSYSGDSHESGIDVRSCVSGMPSQFWSYPGSAGSAGGSGGSPSWHSDLDKGGPIMVHKFYPDRSDQRGVPSWFFAKCSRHAAETILLNNRNHGNTLIRESSTHKDNGSYVISKSFFNDSTKQYDIEHYEVMRVVNGYRINVENTQPEMLCLSAVIDYFASTTGGSAKPMTTNDPVTLGMREPDYITRRIRDSPEPPPAEPWNWPPPDYDHVHGPPRSSTNRNTVSPGMMNQRSGGYSRDSAPGRRWSDNQQPATLPVDRRRDRPNPGMAELTHRVHQNDTLQLLNNAIGTGFQQDQVYVNDMLPHFKAVSELGKHFFNGASKIVKDTTAAKGLNNLLHLLSLEDPVVQREESPEAPPPPPTPHRPASNFYVNEEDDASLHSNHGNKAGPPLPHRPAQQGYVNQQADDPTLRSLPEAPPPPTYRFNRTTAIENSPKQPAQTTPTSSNAQIKQSPHPLHSSPSESVLKTASTGTFVIPALKKSSSDTTFKGSPKSPDSESALKGNLKSPNSPSSFPSWTEPKQVPKSAIKQTVQSRKSTLSESDTSVKDEGPSVDDTNPGGVSDLKSRFENRPVSLQSPLSPTPKAGPGTGGKVTLVKATGSPVSTRPSSVSESKLDSGSNTRGMRHSASLDLSTNTTDSFRTNTAQRPPPVRTNGRKVDEDKRVTNTGSKAAGNVANEFIDDDDLYDDTSLPDKPNFLTGQGQCTLQQSQDQGPPIPSLPRRKVHSFPDIEAHTSHPPDTMTPPNHQSVQMHSPTGSAGVPVAPPPPPPPFPPGTGTQNNWRQQQQSQAPPACNVKAASPAHRALPPRPLCDDQSDFARMGQQMASRRGRRQTEPALFAEPNTQHAVQHGQSGMSAEFKRMLEGKLRGAQERPGSGPRDQPEEEGDYCDIEPDRVTYLDDRFNQ